MAFCDFTCQQYKGVSHGCVLELGKSQLWLCSRMRSYSGMNADLTWMWLLLYQVHVLGHQSVTLRSLAESETTDGTISSLKGCGNGCSYIRGH